MTWIPVTERLPEPGERVLVGREPRGAKPGVVGVAYRRTKKPPLVWTFPSALMAFDPSHWMPLPSPPESA